MKRKALTPLFFICIILQLACTTKAPGLSKTGFSNLPQQQMQDLRALLQSRQDGVNGKDTSTYLKTVLPTDKVLLKEETDLIRAAQDLGVKAYTLSVDNAEKTDSGIVAALTQSYTYDDISRVCTYTVSFLYQDGQLYYAGPTFKTTQSGSVKVLYAKGQEDLATKMLRTETDVLQRMKDLFGYTPKDQVSIKLYDDLQVFLQSVKFDLPLWTGGWHEYGESIKIFTGISGLSDEDYRTMLTHETTHRMVSDFSNDNAAYWVQEGMASVYEDTLFANKREYSKEEAKRECTPFHEQKAVNLESLPISDTESVMLYYHSSKAYIAFLLETYGWDQVRQVLEYLQKFDYLPVTGAEKIDETNLRTDEAVRKILGIRSEAEFQAAFDVWLSGKRK